MTKCERKGRCPPAAPQRRQAAARQARQFAARCKSGAGTHPASPRPTIPPQSPRPEVVLTAAHPRPIPRREWLLHHRAHRLARSIACWRHRERIRSRNGRREAPPTACESCPPRECHPVAFETRESFPRGSGERTRMRKYSSRPTSDERRRLDRFKRVLRQSNRDFGADHELRSLDLRDHVADWKKGNRNGEWRNDEGGASILETGRRFTRRRRIVRGRHDAPGNLVMGRSGNLIQLRFRTLLDRRTDHENRFVMANGETDLERIGGRTTTVFSAIENVGFFHVEVLDTQQRRSVRCTSSVASASPTRSTTTCVA